MNVACAQCGTNNPCGHSYCDVCGAPLQEESRPSSDRAKPKGPRPESGIRGLIRYVRCHASRRSRRPRRHGLDWAIPPPRWELSRPFLKEWVAHNFWELLAVAFLTVAAAFLRVYRLEAIPSGFHGDEAWTGLEGLRILREGWIGPYSTSANGQLTGPFYFTALLVRLLGATKFTVRLSMGLFGVATIPLAHLLLRLGFGRSVALFGTAALTVSYWHIHFSRLGYGVVALPFATTLAAAALLWALINSDRAPPGERRERRKSHWNWLIAGAALGLVPHSYFAFPVFLVAVAAVLFVYFILEGGGFRRKLAPIGLLAAGFLAAAAPVLNFAIHSPDVFFGRFGKKSLLQSHEFVNIEEFTERAVFVAGRVWEAMTLFFRNPRMDGVDGIGGVGVLDFGVATLACLGLAIAMRKWRSPPHLFALLAVTAALTGLVFTDPSAGSMRRSITAVPWVFGLAGLGAMNVVGLCNRLLGNWGRIAAVGCTALVLVGSALWNVRYYFVELPEHQTFQWTFDNDHIEAIEAAHSVPDPGTIYYYSGRRRFSYETIQFLFPESRGIDRSHEFGVFDLERLDTGPVTYLLEGAYMQEIERIREMYPAGELIVDEEQQPRFIVYHLKE